MKTVYLFDSDTLEFTGVYEAFPDPLEDGKFIEPICSTEEVPQQFNPETQTCKFVDGSWIVEAKPEEPKEPETEEEIIRKFTFAVQQRLDTFARTRNYDGILSAATYATSQMPKFQAEGQYAVEARDATWAKCYEILAAVEAGSRPMPTLDALAAELPALAWPQ